MLQTGHDPVLVTGALLVSMLAAFTGLSLTQGLSAMPVRTRKARIAMAAVALGSGIWSMHFIAMLGLQLPVPVSYEPVTTLVSALLAILMAGAALLLLHFRRRNAVTIATAGALLGLGVAAMHYQGMSAMQVCRPVYSAPGIAIPLIAAVGLGILATSIAYGERTRRNILLGTAVFGLAVFAVHYTAMAGTGFVRVAEADPARVAMGNTALALFVALATFALCGGFLLTAATFLAPVPDPHPAAPDGTLQDAAPADTVSIPFERHGRTEFLDPARIAAVRAEGHYTILYSGTDKLFCPWSISKARQRLAACGFAQSHRSYLVNPGLVTGFQRRKDNGVLFFDTTPALDFVPVSRSRIAELRATLGL